VEADFGVERMSIVVWDRSLLDAAGRSRCGPRGATWEVGVETDVTASGGCEALGVRAPPDGSVVPQVTQFRYQWLISYGSNRVWRLGSRVVSVLDSGAEGPGFKSQPRGCRVTVLGKLLTPIVPLFTK